MSKVRNEPNKWEIEEEQGQESKNKQMCSTGEEGICRCWLGELKGHPSHPSPPQSRTRIRHRP